MAFDLGALSNSFVGPLAGWLTSLGGIMLVSFLCGFVAIIGLWWRKRRKLDKEIIEMFDLGEGIFNFNHTKGGWFKKRFTLWGLWDYGNENMFRMADMTPVLDVTHHDYRYINGRLGIVVVRDPFDPKIVVPISKFKIDQKSKSLLAEIAPADLRDASEICIDQADQEMQKNWEKWAPLLVTGFVAIVLVFSILLIAQYGKHNVDVTAETLRYAIDASHGGAATVPPEAIASTTAP